MRRSASFPQGATQVPADRDLGDDGIRFRTAFENKRGATETVLLDRDGDSWKVGVIYRVRVRCANCCRRITWRR